LPLILSDGFSLTRLLPACPGRLDDFLLGAISISGQGSAMASSFQDVCGWAGVDNGKVDDKMNQNKN